MTEKAESTPPPSIMAPAGNKASFFAALAAGADAIYCGLKSFSARMEAKNFTVEQLIPLVALAHENKVKVYIALNTLLKPDEVGDAGMLLTQLKNQVKPDGLIIQDLALFELIKQIGFKGKIHLSTLSDVGFPEALRFIKQKVPIDRIIMPRELSIDEIKTCAQACPSGLDIEVFVHGALCYGISGRCYWSSYLGGKSGLRGQCVQPCRRRYIQNHRPRRYFSCRDFSMDILVKVLLSIPQVRAWKIEGRKKGPHYVYHTVRAYKMLRDKGRDSQTKKEALRLLAYALGRVYTHYNLLSHRPQNPIHTEDQTGSGLLVGRIKGSGQKPFIVTREELIPGDVLRVGYEDDKWHQIIQVKIYVPRGKFFYIKPSLNRGPLRNVPVFLKDRREKELDTLIKGEEARITTNALPRENIPLCKISFPRPFPHKIKPRTLRIYRTIAASRVNDETGLWLSAESLHKINLKGAPLLWWWLPPVIWPDENDSIKSMIKKLRSKGARKFILNNPWQLSYFSRSKNMELWAGPFCNIANALAISIAASMGFTGIIVSPEPGKKDFLLLAKQSPLPLGIVLSGSWPLCISRVLNHQIKINHPFTSPKAEKAWVSRYGQNYWIFPNWKLDLISKEEELLKAGYRLFIHLVEPIPSNVKLKNRPGIWNWDVGLR
ncbi:MAG: U32 family peptidase [bacterium]